MEKKKVKVRDLNESPELAPQILPDYEPPSVLTYRGDDILEELGPAQACTFVDSVAPLCT